MSDNTIWIVTLYIEGPISINNRFKMSAKKEWKADRDPFYSDIEIINNKTQGLKVYVTAKAISEDLAKKAAILFFGRIIDYLAIIINLPLKISNYENIHIEEYEVRRVIDKKEFAHAYYESWRILDKPHFQRSLSWYRKGLNTEDPFDKFLAYWNSIEIIATKYHPKNDTAKKGTISQIWECFKLLWGDNNQWPIINGDENWIDDNNSLRNSIAHGFNNISVKEIEYVTDRLDTIQQAAYKFIVDWRKKQIGANGVVPTRVSYSK
ncbi:MAG: HEPN domain-containing protein [Spirochaetia bacterium]|nr:HEPN domain-containing protein [Spirochaetia bacterium]